MATRLYSAGVAPGSPAIAAGWEGSAGLLRCAASIDAADYVQQRNTSISGSGVANDDQCHMQWIYGPIAAQTISGNVKGQMFTREGGGTVDARAQLVIRVFAPDFSTVRGTALNFDTSALSNEFPISAVDTDTTNRKFPKGGSAALTSVVATAGDYVVIEIGHRNHGTGTNGVRVVSGQPTATTDLPEDETTAASVSSGSTWRGWIEFSNTIAPYTAASAAATGALAVTANQAKTTIKPTGGNATLAVTAYDATVSNLVPPRTLTINSVDYIDKMRWDSFSFVECANRGQVGMGGFDVDDATNSLTIPALKGVLFNEPAAGIANQRTFTGFTHDRTTERGPNKVAGQRQWGVEVLDLNTLADDYILTAAESADRPAETDYARVVWLLTTRFNTVAGVASGVVPNSNTANMDAVDYRGRRARDVLAECSEMAGKNWFIYQWTTATPLLFYDVTSGSNLTSSARISDVAADIDSSVTWAASNVKVHKSPDDVYSTVHLRWNEGTVTVTNATTASTYRTREISVTDMSIDTSTKATAKANAFLTASQYERVRVDQISVQVPAANINDIRAGQRIHIKLDRHGISAFTYYRVLERRIEPVNDVSYKITLTLADQVLPVLYSGGGRGGDLPYGIWEKKSNATDDGATVIIDRGGITINDGAMAISDEFGSTVMSATSFTGSWADFVRLGLYNARFQTASAGVIQAGRTSDLPFWTAVLGTTGVLTTLSGGGLKATWTGTADQPYVTSDAVPVQPGAVVETAFAMLANRAAGTLEVDAFVYWYQHDGSASATPFTNVADFSSATSVTSLLWIRDAVVVPDDALSAKFQLRFEETSHNAANSITVYAAKLQDIPVTLGPFLGIAPTPSAGVSPGSGTVSDYDPGVPGLVMWRMQPSAALSLTGIVAPASPAERVIFLMNYSNFAITLKHDVTSTAANRFYCPGGVDFSLATYGTVILFYNPNLLRWNVVAKA